LELIAMPGREAGGGIAVINGHEKKVFAKNDFIRTESYVIRLKTKGIEKLMELLNTQFAVKVKYKNQNWQWSSIIDLKAQELANYLLGKRKDIDFCTPSYKLDRIDNKELRDKILAISYSEWKKLGYSKGSLNYLKKNAKSDKPFYIQKRMKDKLENV